MRTLVHHLIEQQATERGDAPALSFKADTVSYRDLWNAVGAVESGLLRLGMRRNDRVGVYLDKRIETVTAIFGASRGGGVFVPINPVLRSRQVGHILNDCDVRFLITSSERLSALLDELGDAPSVECVVLVDGASPVEVAPATRTYEVQAWTDVFADVIDSDRARDQPGAQRIDVDMAAILYTSGSTGNPKGVVLSHRNLIVGAESVSTYLGNDSSDVILAALPISFDAGFSQLTTAFSVGAHAVLVNFLVPADVVRACVRHRVTGLTCVPPLWIQLADRTWPAEAVDSLRYFANTGGRMPKATLDSLRATFPTASPFLMYGLTEAFRSTYLDPSEVDRRPSSIGKAIPNAEILVVRPDGTLCDPDEEGELVHRGALVALGYWNDPERTAERFRPVPDAPAWRAPELAVWSGDSVVRDEEGFLYFVGRADEMIKTSGYRVSPTEIEEAVYDTGVVRDVVAFGVDDDALGQRIVVVVTAKLEGALDLEHLRGELRQQLPLYMLPSTILVRDDIPRSPNGKFDRKHLRSTMDA